MSKSSKVSLSSVFVLSSALLLTSCGGGGGGNSSDQALFDSQLEPQSDSQIFIAGAGVKGPLAFANVELYALDTRFSELYEPGNPIAATTTDAYAEISGLAVPDNIAPPYVLVIDGTNAIDRNTDQAPVIKKLITIITQESLDAGEPVYATPYTTLAYHMLRLDQRGDGLYGTYYNDLSLSNVAMERIDSTVNFDWQRGSPATAVNADGFSVRWTGMVEPDYTSEYKFHTSTDDGVRLWVDDTMIVDQWTNQSETQYSGTIGLTAGQKYSIVMEYYDNSGGAAAKLFWSRPGVPKSVIPTANLYSQAVSTARVSDPLMGDAMAVYNQQIIESASFGLSPEANIFTTPAIITSNTTSIEQQQLVVHYRAAIEALSSLLYEMSLASSSGTTADMMLQKLALDLYNDGAIDGQPSGIDTKIIFRDPMTVDIANTQYLVQDIVSLMDEERALTGNAGDVIFLKDSVSVNLQFIDAAYEPLPDQLTQNIVVSAPAPVPLNTVVASSPSSSDAEVLKVRFENRSKGPYKESDLRSDFNVGDRYNESVHGPDWGSVDIVADPAKAGKGNVMRVLHRAGYKGGSLKAGGMRFRADLPPAKEYYLAYDYYIPSNWWNPQGAKIPGLINGTMLEASHPTGSGTAAENLRGFTAIYHVFGDVAYGRGDGSFAGYFYDKDNTAGNDWCNTVDPTSQSSANTYRLPKGKWVTIEQRVKLNTVNKKNGLFEIWVNGKKLSSKKHRWIANLSYPGNNYDNSSRRIDGIWMYDYYGGSNVKLNAPPTNQYAYYDNFIVSTSPITH